MNKTVYYLVVGYAFGTISCNASMQQEDLGQRFAGLQHQLYGLTYAIDPLAMPKTGNKKELSAADRTVIDELLKLLKSSTVIKQSLDLIADKVIERLSERTTINNYPSEIRRAVYQELLKELGDDDLRVMLSSAAVGIYTMKIKCWETQDFNRVVSIFWTDGYGKEDAEMLAELVCVLDWFQYIRNTLLGRIEDTLKEISNIKQSIVAVTQNSVSDPTAHSLFASLSPEMRFSLNAARAESFKGNTIRDRYLWELDQTIKGRDVSMVFEIPLDVFTASGGKVQFNPKQLLDDSPAQELYKYAFSRLVHYFAPSKKNMVAPIKPVTIEVGGILSVKIGLLLTPYTLPGDLEDDVVLKGAEEICAILLYRIDEMLTSNPKHWAFDLEVKINNPTMQQKWNEFMKDFVAAFNRLARHTREQDQKKSKN